MNISLKIATPSFSGIANMAKSRFSASIISEPAAVIDNDYIHSRLFGVEWD